MRFDDLPPFICDQIVLWGDLEVEDVISLSFLSRKLRLLYTSESIWKRLYELHWGLIGRLYGLEEENIGLMFERSVKCYNRHLKIMTMVNQYSPKTDYNFIGFMDSIIDDPMNIPVLVRIEKMMQRSIDQSMKKNIDYIDISKHSVVLNMILALNFKIGYESLNNTIEETSFELVLLKIDIFSKSFHHLIENRNIKISLIERLLHDQIYIKRLKYHKNHRIQLINDNIINFDHEITYTKFVTKIAKIILSTFSCKRLNLDNFQQYFDDFYIEDYSILFIYSDLSKGHPKVLMSIILERLKNFLDQFKIYINDELIEIDIRLTKDFIRLPYGVYLYLNPVNNKYHPYEIKIQNESQVRNLLRFRFGFSDDKIKQYVSSITCQDLLQDILETTVPSISDTIKSSTQNHINTRNFHDDQFIKLLIKMVVYKSNPDHGFSLNIFKSLSRLNNFIYLKSIYSTIKHDEAKVSMFTRFTQKMALEDSKFEKFTLTSQDCKLLFESIRKLINTHHHKTQSSPFPTGSVVRHKRSQLLGIVVSSFEEPEANYIIVYSTNDLIEIFDANSIDPLPTNPKIKLEQLTQFYNTCSSDVLGLLICEAIDMVNYKFITYI